MALGILSQPDKQRRLIGPEGGCLLPMPQYVLLCLITAPQCCAVGAPALRRTGKKLGFFAVLQEIQRGKLPAVMRFLCRHVPQNGGIFSGVGCHGDRKSVV